ncbi:MAG TPA: hypothetical protein VKR31_14830 [Rhizomicrobium sp.]|nr:hypothetical protein [Rhizomicrobium sp.]
MREESTLRDIERAIVRIARSMGRRDMGRLVERTLGSRIDVSFLQLIGAVDELTEPGEAPTIKDIARWLDVHHSRASRLVKDTIRAGFLMRLASQEDARKSPLALSEKGREIAEAIHAARTKHLAARLHGFSKSDRRTFAQLLGRFAASKSEAHGNTGQSGPAAAVAPSPRRHRTRPRRKRTA